MWELGRGIQEIRWLLLPQFARILKFFYIPSNEYARQLMKAILRKLLPSSTFEQLQKYRAKVDFSLAKLCAKSKFSSSLFYFFINGQFGREHQSVLHGRVAYHESLAVIKESSALLRRNIHRLEKGLIMEPRKPSFGEAYIGETVSIFSQCLTKEGFNKGELSKIHA